MSEQRQPYPISLTVAYCNWIPMGLVSVYVIPFYAYIENLLWFSIYKINAVPHNPICSGGLQN